MVSFHPVTTLTLLPLASVTFAVVKSGMEVTKVPDPHVQS